MLEVLFSPVEFEGLNKRDLSRTICVVFDVFRATTTIVTALANGASAIIPVAEISDAVALRHKKSDILLAGERSGLRIRADQTGGIDFDFGNSPREFTRERVRDTTIGLTTTNGSRALCACAQAMEVLVCSFLNLAETFTYVKSKKSSELLLVCSGTGYQAAYEDILGAGAFAGLACTEFSPENIADSTRAALEIYRRHRIDLPGATKNSLNGLRLLSIPDLRDDVPYCLQQDIFPLVAKLRGDSIIKLDPLSFSVGRI